MEIDQLDIFAMLQLELENAREKHPEFPEVPAEGMNVILEEVLELVRSVNDNESLSRQREEAFHVAVTALRFIVNNLKLEN